MFKKKWLPWFAAGLALCCLIAFPAIYYLYPGSNRNAETRPSPAEEAAETSPENGYKSVLGSPAKPFPGAADMVKPGRSEDQAVTVQLFFISRQAAESGREGNFGLVEPVSRTLPYEPGVLRLALRELMRGPLPEETGLLAVLPGSVDILNLELHEGLAVIDLSGEAMPDRSWGSTAVIAFIQSLVYTATQFPTVDRIVVLVEGDPWHDGHFIWDEPLDRGDLPVQEDP